MENQRINDHKKSKNNLQVAQWQWQSDVDPWKDNNPLGWNWQNYSYDMCVILEKGFTQKKEIADLGVYEMDFKKMVQVNKKERHRMRRIRRLLQNRFLIEVPKLATIVPKSQKTIEKSFGTIQYYINSITYKVPEVSGLFQRLMIFPLDSEKSQFEGILIAVVACIEEGAETREKFANEGKWIGELIKANSKSLREFLRIILKVYTMESFIWHWLNEALQSENWEETRMLAPFLACLMRAFGLPEYYIKSEQPKGLMGTLRGFVAKQALCLYKGAALSKEDLAQYNDEKVKYFSWNSLVSTSKNMNVAKHFMQFSLNELKTRVGVLFLIEPVASAPGIIDIFQGVDCLHEEEVLLAPGTVFKLRKVSLTEDGVYEIHLKIKKSFKEEIEENAALLKVQEERKDLVSVQKEIHDLANFLQQKDRTKVNPNEINETGESEKQEKEN